MLFRSELRRRFLTNTGTVGTGTLGWLCRHPILTQGSPYTIAVTGVVLGAKPGNMPPISTPPPTSMLNVTVLAAMVLPAAQTDADAVPVDTQGVAAACMIWLK